MAIQTLKEGAKYRIFVDRFGAGGGRRRQFTEVFYGTRVEAEGREIELKALRDSDPLNANMTWPKLAFSPEVFARLRELSDQAQLSPEEFLAHIIRVMAEE